MFLIVDSDYKTIRDCLWLAWITSDYSLLKVLLDNCKDKPVFWCLAIHHLINLSPAKIKDPSAFKAIRREHPWLSNIWGKCQEPIYQNLFGKSHRHNLIYNLLIHFKESIILHNNVLPQLLHIFGELANNPRNCANLFLPTMPHDEIFEAKNAVKDAAWYFCSKGHYYAIGDCGRPAQEGKCPDCHEPIGGRNYSFVKNVPPAQQPSQADQTMPGYVLGEARAETRSVAVRETGGLEIAVIRFLLHSAMYHGCQTQLMDVHSIISPRLLDANSIEEFVAMHLQLNLKQIADCLGKSESDAIVLMHQLISRLATPPNIDSRDWTLKTKAQVRMWEAEFVKQCIQPVLANLEIDIVRQKTAESKDKEEAMTVLTEILNVTSPTTNNRSNVLSLAQFWRPREKNVRIEGLELKVGSNCLKDHCPFLLKILQEEPNFCELARLPKLIQLAQFFIKNYNRQLNVEDMDKMTVDKFLNEMDVNDQRFVTPLIQTFLAALTNLKTELFALDQ